MVRARSASAASGISRHPADYRPEVLENLAKRVVSRLEIEPRTPWLKALYPSSSSRYFWPGPTPIDANHGRTRHLYATIPGSRNVSRSVSRVLSRQQPWVPVIQSFLLREPQKKVTRAYRAARGMSPWSRSVAQLARASRTFAASPPLPHDCAPGWASRSSWPARSARIWVCHRSTPAVTRPHGQGSGELACGDQRRLGGW